MAENSKLEVASWVAGILGTVIALVTAFLTLIPKSDPAASQPSERVVHSQSSPASAAGPKMNQEESVHPNAQQSASPPAQAAEQSSQESKTDLQQAPNDRVGALAFEAPPGWTRHQAISGAMFVPLGEIPPEHPGAGLRSVGILIGREILFSEDGSPFAEGVGMALDQDASIVQRSAVSRIASAQPGVEAYATEMIMAQNGRRVLAKAVHLHTPGRMIGLTYSAVSPELYRKYEQAFLALVMTARVN